MSYARGLGEDGINAVAAARAKLEAHAGIPYTGPATTVEAFLALDALDVRIANNDQSAFIEAATYPDPWMQSIAIAYLTRMSQMSDTIANWIYLVKTGKITPDLYQRVTGQSIQADQAWQIMRESRATEIIYPILGGGGIRGSRPYKEPELLPNGVFNDGYLYDKSVYDFDFDYADLRKHATEYKNKVVAEGARLTAISDEARARAAAQAAKDQGEQPAGPPSGWRYTGSNSWFGPNGLLYNGDEQATPWTSGDVGYSVNRLPPPTNTPIVPPSVGARPEDLNQFDEPDVRQATNTPILPATTAPAATTTGPTNGAVPQPPPLQYGSPELPQDFSSTTAVLYRKRNDAKTETLAPLAAGLALDSKTVLLGAAALAAAYFLTRKK